MVYNIASAGSRISTWLTDNVSFSRTKAGVSQTERKWMATSLIVPVLAGVLCASIVDSVAVGGQGRAALTQIVKDPAAMFEGRSPGERGAGAMYQTKHKAVGTPTERTLANVPVEPAQDMGLPVVADAADPVATALFAQPDTPPADIVPLADVGGTPPSFFVPGPGIGPILGGGSGGSDNPGGGDTPVEPGTPVDPNTPPPPPVPEPATWLTLIAGLFTTGAVLRYQRRAFAKNLSAQPAR